MAWTQDRWHFIGTGSQQITKATFIFEVDDKRINAKEYYGYDEPADFVQAKSLQ